MQNLARVSLSVETVDHHVEQASNCASEQELRRSNFILFLHIHCAVTSGWLTRTRTMAKLLVIDSDEGTKVPFLRGILTGSLQDVGLKFDEAYDLATQVRDQLSGEGRIKSADLRRLVASHLRSNYDEYIADRYQSDTEAAEHVMVRNEAGQAAPFLVETHRKSLDLCGIDDDDARHLSRGLGAHLVARRRKEVRASHLGRLTYRLLQREIGKSAAHRYLVWQDFSRRGLPLLLLIGGAPGSGKSTIATSLASRLDIFRTQSTDMLREIMRMMTPDRLLPVLHRSSFDAWRALPQDDRQTSAEDRVVQGYRAQTDLLAVSCEAVAQRAVRERVSMVLEGVHINPTVIRRLQEVYGDVIVVPVMLAIRKQELLRKRFSGRGGLTPQRRAERYLKNFDAIWQVQSYLLSEADRAQIPIVVNEDREETISEISKVIVDALSTKLKSTMREVFPETS